MGGRFVAAMVVAICVALLFSGCLSTGEVDGNVPPTLEPVEPEWEASADAQMRRMEEQAPVESVWSCSYDPTYDQNWHNDVVCTDGNNSTRPVVRPDDSYITPSEALRFAREYENALNSGMG
jgi:hypothetical protein